MSWASDDLVPPLRPPEREHGGYGQGVLRAWDAGTFENVVEYRGSMLANLPVLNAVDALTYRPGDVVLLMRWTPTGSGLSSYWIAGRALLPGAGRPEQAIAFMETTLARQIVDELVEQLLTSPAGIALAAFVFGQRVTEATVATSQSTTSTTYTDLATVGPTVPNVEITNAGKALVLLSAGIGSSFAPVQSYMSVDVTGPTASSPTDARSLHLVVNTSAGLVGSTRVLPFTGLAAGTYSFQAKYRMGTGSTNATFYDRTLAVMAF